jgi:hypothetical protein
LEAEFEGFNLPELKNPPLNCPYLTLPPIRWILNPLTLPRFYPKKYFLIQRSGYQRNAKNKFFEQTTIFFQK